MLKNFKSKLSDPAQHYEVFLFGMMIFYVFSIIFALKFALEVASMAQEAETFSQLTFIGLTMGGFVISVCFIGSAYFANKLIKENKTLGFIITIILAVMMVPSVMFPVGLFGLYSVLNRRFREKFFLENRPLWLDACFSQVEKLTAPRIA